MDSDKKYDNIGFNTQADESNASKAPSLSISSSFIKGHVQYPLKGNVNQEIKAPGACGVNWLTLEMAEDAKLTRDIVIKQAIREFVAYTVFLILLNILMSGYAPPTEYTYQKTIRENLLERRDVRLHQHFPQTPADVATRADFWKYLNQNFFKSPFWKLWSNASHLKQVNTIIENRLIGIPRMRQVRMKMDTCKVATKMEKIISSCISAYTMENEQTSKFGANEKFEWAYSESDLTKSGSFRKGSVLYGGGGYFKDFPVTTNVYQTDIAHLHKENWIDHQTRAVFIDLIVYNSQINYFGRVKLLFEFQPTGGVQCTPYVTSLKMIHTFTAHERFLFGLELVLSVHIFYYIAEFMHSLCYFRKRCITNIWLMLDCLIVITAALSVVLRAAYKIKSSMTAKAILMSYDYNKEHINIDGIVDFNYITKEVFGYLILFCWIRVAKYLKYLSKTMDKILHIFRKVLEESITIVVSFNFTLLILSMVAYYRFRHQSLYTSFGDAFVEFLEISIGSPIVFSEATKAIYGQPVGLFLILTLDILLFFYKSLFFIMTLDAIHNYEREKIVNSAQADKLYINTFVVKWFKELTNWIIKHWCRCCLSKAEDVGDENVTTTIREITDALIKLKYPKKEVASFLNKYDLTQDTAIGLYDINVLSTHMSGSDDPQIEIAELGPMDKISIKDFEVMSLRITKMEVSIQLLLEKVDILLQKLETLEAMTNKKFSEN